MSFGQPNNPDIKVQGNTITIDTSLRVGLEQFREYPERRGGVLSSLSQSIAGITGRKPMCVKVVPDDTDMRITSDSISIGQQHVQKALDWEANGVDKGSSAIFGDVARAISKRTGTTELGHTVSAVHEVVGYITKDKSLQSSIEKSVGSYVSVYPGLRQLTGEFPGLSGAIMASYVMQHDALNPAPLFESEKASDRWRAAWTTIMAEALSPGSVGAGTYPSEQIEQSIKLAAEYINKAADPVTGKLDGEAIKEMIYCLVPVFEGSNDDDNDSDMDSLLDADGEHMAVPVADKKSIGIGYDLGNSVKVMPAPKFRGITPGQLSSVFREYLLDTRLEGVAGQQTGRVNNQLHRIITDQRVFSKRVRVSDPPDACVVVAVDFSGSMGKNTSEGTRLYQACELHDAIVSALNDLDVAVSSCGYCGAEKGSHIYPFSIANTFPMGRSAFSLADGYMGGNGDVGAMLWSTKEIADSKCSKGAVIFLADGEVSDNSARVFRQRAGELDTAVFHVDYINATTSPFGGEHIHAGDKTIQDIAVPLARGLARVLDLE